MRQPRHATKKRKVGFQHDDTEKGQRITPKKGVEVVDKGKRKAAPPEGSLPAVSKFTIIVGSYEKLLYGIDVDLENHENHEGMDISILMKPVFIFPAHVSSVKAVAASPGGKWLATGSSDEIIKLWDLRKKKEVGGLMQHEGSITHLAFPTRTHLVSCAEDGSIALFRTRDWTPLRVLKGHKGRVNSVAVHPSSKVALSVGVDRTLRMWDLTRGKGTASTKLGKEAEIVRWSPTGKHFVVQTHSSVDIYATNMSILYSFTHPSRIQDVSFCTIAELTLLLVAAEDKLVTVYELGLLTSTEDGADPTRVPTVLARLTGHANRVKSIDSVPGPNDTLYVASASSDGKIHVYQLFMPSPTTSTPVEIEPLAGYDSKGSRLTCLTIASPLELPFITVAGHKRLRNDEEDESDEDDQLRRGRDNDSASDNDEN